MLKDIPFSNPLESEGTEKTPLIRSLTRDRTLTRRKKLERIARILDRVFNPLHDAGIGGIIFIAVNWFGIRYMYTGQEEPRFPLSLSLSIFSLFTLITATSLSFEVVNSYRLSKHSRFLLGENQYEHAKILMQELTAIVDIQTVPHDHFEKWIINLKQSSKNNLIQTLIQDYERVNQYNHIRTVIDDISVLVLALYLLSLIIVSPSLLGYLLKIIPTSLVTIFIFSIKIYNDKIEHNWIKYEERWKNLSLSWKKTLLVFKNIIDGLYHFTLSTVALDLSVNQIVHYPTIRFNPALCGELALQIDGGFFMLALPIGIAYTGLQLVSEHRCCPNSNIFYQIKRWSRGIVQGTKIAGLLSSLSLSINLVTCNLFSYDPNSGGDEKILLSLNLLFYTFSILSIMSWIITTINTILNYQEPDPNKMSTVDHDVSKLREEIVDIKESLLEEAGHERHGGVNAAMHGKSEIAPIPKDTFLENTQRSTDRSLLSAFCCFWERSDNHKDTAESHSSSHLRETVNFQSV